MGYVCEEKIHQERLKENDFSLIVQLVKEGMKRGSEVFNIQLMHPSLDEEYLFPRVMEKVLEETSCAIAIDSRNIKIIEEALKIYPYKAMCNCVNGEKSNLKEMLPVIAKYGGAIGTALVDEDGIPQTVKERVKVGKVIVEAAEAYGIPREDVILDAVCLPIGVVPDSAQTTLETIKAFREVLGVSSLLGVSNAGFMMPNPRVIDLTFYISAVAWGLDVAMIDPKTPNLELIKKTSDLLMERDSYAKQYLKYCREKNIFNYSE
jgi:5-methyltetrahydrofolate--homocysteine methyltransferase